MPVCSIVRRYVYICVMLFSLGAEVTQQMKSISSNVPSTAAGTKSAGQQIAKTEAASVSKPTSSHHHKTAASIPARVPAPGGGLFQRPIRPTQVEPSRPDVPPLMMAAAAAGKQQQQQQPLYRPPPPRRLLLFIL